MKVVLDDSNKLNKLCSPVFWVINWLFAADVESRHAAAAMW
jgi:hypothetical protein